MKRGLSDEEPIVVSDLSNVSIDVIECIMRVMGDLDDVCNMSLACKRFYEASRRKSIVSRWKWDFTCKKSYVYLKDLYWFNRIEHIEVSALDMLQMLTALGLCLKSVLFDAFFTEHFDYPNLWPKTIETIEIVSVRWNHPIAGLLPNHLTELIIDSNNFNQPLRLLPPRLKVLDITSYAYMHRIDEIPDTITHLKFAFSYMNPFDLSTISRYPSSLKSLDVGDGCMGVPDFAALPKTLKTLSIHRLGRDSNVNFPFPLERLRIAEVDGLASNIRVKASNLKEIMISGMLIKLE
jgi:hypothetical protein